MNSPILNFTPRAQQALALARKEADRLNHKFIGTEHLLLGLMALGQGVSVTVLQKLGLNLDALRNEVFKLVGSGMEYKAAGNPPYTPTLKRAVAFATEDAKALNHSFVGTEHLFLGILRGGTGVAARVLKGSGVDIEATRKEILKELDPHRGGD